MLKMTLTHGAVGCRVELCGVDITNHLTGIEISANVHDLTKATLKYTGAVVVEGEAGQIALEQAEHLVTCKVCERVLRGEKHEDTIVDTTRLGSKWRTYVPAEAPSE